MCTTKPIVQTAIECLHFCMTDVRFRRWNIVETHCVVTQKAPAGAKFVNNYRVLHTLGQGRFGKVKLCERVARNCRTADTSRRNDVQAVRTSAEDGDNAASSLPPRTFAPSMKRQFALKIYSKTTLRRLKEYCAKPAVDQLEEGQTCGLNEAAAPCRMQTITAFDRVRDEIAIMRSLYHRNIVLLFEVIEADDSDKLYLVLEYMACGPCMVYRPATKDFYSPVTGGTLSEELARSYVSDILLGLQYLHDRRICHRDIKPENVLLNGAGRCHISDFGCARAFGDIGEDGVLGVARPNAAPVLLSDTVGTYQFLAPECCSGEAYDPFKADIWAVGIVLYIFMFGRLPFRSESTRDLFEEIARGTIVVPGTAESVRELPLSHEGQDLLYCLLEKNPEQRISTADALCHPWFMHGDEPLSF